MLRKHWGIAVLLAFALAAAWTIAGAGGSPAPAARDGAYQWRFTEWGTAAKPQTRVVLVADGTSHDAGTYDGSCAVQAGDYLEYEASRVVCWHPGGGHEVGVFEEPGQVVVRVGDIDEGASGVEGFRGNFTLLKRIR
jgi:hypothetical protein